MKTCLAFASLAAAGCAVVPAPAGIPEHGVTGSYTCNKTCLDQFIGQPATTELGSKMLRVSGARIIRWVRVGEMITMEYNPERLTARLGPGNKTVTMVSCG